METMEDASELRTDGSSLLKAVYLRRLRLTRLLLEGGAYVNESNERGETPLMVACRTRHADAQSVPKPKMVRYLLESGADPNIQDKAGKTALMHACLEQAGAEVLALLLASGADPSLEDRAGSSALVCAVAAGDKGALRVLLDACKAKGKEVIIITTDMLPSGRQMTKQYLNVPPPPDPEERLRYSPAPCCASPSEIQFRTPPPPPPPPASANASPQPGSPLRGLGEPPGSAGGSATPPPGSPTREPGPLQGRGAAKLLHRLHSEPWLKIPASLLLLQQSKSSSFAEETPGTAAAEEEEALSVGANGPSFCGRSSAVARHQSAEVKDASGLLKAPEQAAESHPAGAGGRRGTGRKMSYDGAAAASSPQSSSHPSLLPRDGSAWPCALGPVPAADKCSGDGLPSLAVSSLRDVVRRRNIGVDHYSSDSQLLQFATGGGGGSGHPEDGARGVGGGGLEKRKLVTSRSSTLSGSRESLEGAVQRRGPLERRGSGALLLDHIAHTRPGYLPPLNPHAPIPDIGAGPASACPASGSSKALNRGVPPKPLVPCAPLFPRDPRAKNTLLRRHSMQTEQIKQLANFEVLFGR